MGLVERSNQITQLTRLFGRCRDGQSGLAFISGPVATGKSRLLQHFADLAAQEGAVVLCANGSAAERALPFGLFTQLLHNVPPLVDVAVADVPPAMPEQSALEQVRLMERCRAALLALARTRPLVICVDDAHDADPASLHCLLYCVRRMRAAGVLFVLTAEESHRERPALLTEVLRLPYCHQVRAVPLTGSGVAALISEHLGPETAERCAPAWFEVSGGNPLLLQALIDDHQGIPGPDDAPSAGHFFHQAVLSCLRRDGPAMTRVARALAVLDGDSAPGLVTELSDLDPISVEEATHALASAGLIKAGRFRDPQTRRVVLASTPPADQARLHLRAGRLLHDGGATALTVARQIIAAGHSSEPWSYPVLRDAADQALAGDQPELAADCLRLAVEVSPDEAGRAATEALLASTQWRIDPVGAQRHLPSLLNALLAGALDDRDVRVPLNLLLWHGKLGEIRGVLDHLREQPADSRIGMLLRDLRPWLAVLYPSLLPEARTAPPEPTAWAVPESPDGRPGLMPAPDTGGVLALHLVLSGRIHDGVREAGRVLESLRLDAASLAAISNSLQALLYADELDQAAAWCDELHDEAVARRAPSWQAVLDAIRAEIAMRRGDLRDAEHRAWSALRRISPAGWGVGVGLPLGTLIRASSAQGKVEEAEVALGMPTPETLPASRYGPQLLYARGVHQLSRHRFRAAIKDFRACGELLVAWDMDLPTFIPWRIGAAAAYVRIGEPALARLLVHEQTQRPGGAGARMRAEALAVLRQCEGRFVPSGDPGRYPPRRLRPAAPAAPPVRRRERGGPGKPVLSKAERRVAALAARGCPNREIAKKLEITVSTVEQHLTRVYRKLDLAGREDLAGRLHELDQVA